MRKKNKLAVLISGRGSNMVALAKECEEGTLDAEILFVASDRSDAAGLKTASSMHIPTMLLPYPDKVKAEEQLAFELHKQQVDWVILAGFMRILSPRFVEQFRGQIINIHPSLLPSFPGAHAIQEAWEYGVKITGVTVHYVDEQVDHGPILAQEAIPVLDSDTIETLEERIHVVEHRLYSAALQHLFKKNPKERTMNS